MAGATKRLTTRDTLLLIIAATGGRIDGRTRMQKLAYFAGLQMHASFAHRAHFYGPYSTKVEDALGFATEGGDLEETLTRLPSWQSSGREVVQYDYELTEQGRKRADQLAAQFAREAAAIKKTVDAIREVLPDLNQTTLSAAAKTFLIISEGGEVDEQDIPSLAEQLGWQLTAQDVQKTVQILEHLDLLEDAEPSRTV